MVADVVVDAFDAYDAAFEANVAREAVSEAPWMRMGLKLPRELLKLIANPRGTHPLIFLPHV